MTKTPPKARKPTRDELERLLRQALDAYPYETKGCRCQKCKVIRAGRKALQPGKKSRKCQHKSVSLYNFGFLHMRKCLDCGEQEVVGASLR